MGLIRDEQSHLGEHDERLAGFPASLQPQLRSLAASTLAGVDTTMPTSLLHGDLHDANIFVDPLTGALTAIIDLNEMYAGDRWYDLADACFRLLDGEPTYVPHLLAGYGLSGKEPAADTALRLLGWALLHDWDILTDTCRQRGMPDTNLADLAIHLTGLDP